MDDSSQSLQGNVSKLNQHISEFNEFAESHGYTNGFAPIHFLGTPDSVQGERALIDHWDEFLQFSQNVLNTESVPRDDALGHVDTINLVYKRSLAAVQALK